MNSRYGFVSVVSLLLLTAPLVANEAKSLSEASRLQIALEALNRIESRSSDDPALKEALAAVLEKVRGTPDFVRIVKKFNLRDQASGLLEIARTQPGSEAGVEAARLLLAQDDPEILSLELKQTPSVGLVQALGNANDQKAVTLLLPLLTDSTPDRTTRQAVVRALARTQEGANELLRIVRSGKLAADLRLTAGEELNAVRWPRIKTEAEQLLPLPKALHSEPLPSLAQMSQMKGNADNGEKIYFNETVGCALCHRVQGRGVEVGPDLSEIGTKLAREALFEAILDPNAGISLGYETHQIELNSGDEAYGLLASETEEEVTIKDLKGILTRIKKSDIATRKQLSTSIMPTGLTEGLSPQELVDLVDYLAGLKKLN